MLVNQCKHGHFMKGRQLAHALMDLDDECEVVFRLHQLWLDVQRWGERHGGRRAGLGAQKEVDFR